MVNQQQTGKSIVEAFDGELRREGAHFGSAINNPAWGHMDVSGNGTVMIEMRRNVSVELAVKIECLLRKAPHLCAGQRRAGAHR